MPCPQVYATGSHSTTAGLSDDGTLLYTTYTTGLEVKDFPALTFNADIDLDPAMNSLGASGGGAIRSGTLADDGYAYLAGFVTSSTNIQMFKVLLDGTGEDLLWTAGAATGTDVSIGWHPNDADHIYLLYRLDAGGARFSKIHRTTGTETIVDTFAQDYFANRNTLGQYEEGFVFFAGTTGSPNTGDIWVYDIAADAFDSLTATTSFGGAGTRYDGYTIWNEDFVGNGGDYGIHSFTIDPGPTITVGVADCADPWDGSTPTYWFATPDRSQVYSSDGFYVWVWGAANPWTVGRVHWGGSSGWH